MKTKNCIIIGLTTVTALLTFVGCSTSNTNPDLMTSSLAAKAPAMSALSGGPGSYCGGFTATGGTLSSCGGDYNGYANITNSATGTMWFTPPAGTTNGLATDSSGFEAPYTSTIRVTRSDNISWCGTNSVSFPVINTKKYKFVIYVQSTTPPPTNGQPVTLGLQWNP